MKASRLWHEAARKRDAEDIASGRRTPEEVNKQNAFIQNAAEWKDVDMDEMLRRCYEDDDTYAYDEKGRTMRETLDLRDWLRRCQAVGVPSIPAEMCPFEIGVGEILSGDMRGIEALSSWTEEKTREVADRSGRAMWRWSICAPIEIKAAVSHPGMPVRMSWPAEATDDARFLAILADCRASGMKTVTTFVRPWVEVAQESGFPVEFRVFVSDAGGTSTTSYYTQRPLSQKWFPYAKKAASLAWLLRRQVAGLIEYSADFLVTNKNDLLFIEGGPPPRFGADPCLFASTHPFGDGCIRLAL